MRHLHIRPVLGASPLIGEAFAPADDRVGASRNILLSHGFCSRAIEGAPDVVGRSVVVSGRDLLTAEGKEGGRDPP